MEDASKALMIAGAVLVSILVVATGVQVYNSTGKGAEEQAKQTSEKMWAGVDANLGLEGNEEQKGIEDKGQTITHSDQEIKFKNTIKQANILNEKSDYTSYEIKGISLEKEGEYITTGSLTGKSGKLKIVGDINNTTFEYELTSIMKGDDVFYCKVDIDGEEYYQEIRVAQGDVVFYEEDMLNIREYVNDKEKTFPEVDGAPNCVEIEGDLWSGGKAKKVYSDKDTFMALDFYLEGSKVAIIWGKTGKSNAHFMPFITTVSGANIQGKSLRENYQGLGQGCHEWEIYSSDEEEKKAVMVSIEIFYQNTSLVDPGNEGEKLNCLDFVIDGIKIWK